ncbi:MAG: hypothetical protein KGH87_02355 [Thaumarchaeota archaeon]|nr:hypothetical protein [Nitrososphaerota archaeon]
MKRRAVQSAYAISLLIAVAIGMSALVYVNMSSSNDMLSSNAQYTINSASLTGIQSGTMTWYDIVVQNTGTKSFVQTQLSIVINSVTYNLPQNVTAIGPGMTIEQKGILSTSVVFGTPYTVRVGGTTSDGSTYVTSRQINAG